MKKFFVILNIFLLSIIVRGQVPVNGLIAYYPFNGNANDESGNGNHGSVSGAVLASSRFGESNAAYSFDGTNDGITVPGFMLNPLNFTISLWFNARTEGDINTKEILQRSNPGDKNDWAWNISWYKKNGPSRVYSGVKTAQRRLTDSTGSVSKNSWHNVIMTWDGNYKKLYIDGSLKDSLKFTGTIDYTNQTALYFGFDSGTNFFNGLIDDIRIYDRVLEPGERSELFYEGNWLKVTLLSPTGGEDFVAGANHEIKWTTSGVASIRIDYSLDSGMTWINLVDFLNNSGVFVWTTPNITAMNCFVKVSNSANANMFDMSSSVFSIQQYKVSILSPDGGEVCGIGRIFPITWNSNNVRNVNIDYSTDNGTTWLPVAASYPSTGVYNWTVPNTPSAQARIRISNTDTLSVNDISAGAFTITEITGVKDNTGEPVSFSLEQNYPNPFNPSTKIKFSLPAAIYVELRIYDLLGKEVSTLISRYMEKGQHEVTFNAEHLPSGIYFYCLNTGNNILTRKMQLVK